MTPSRSIVGFGILCGILLLVAAGVATAQSGSGASIGAVEYLEGDVRINGKDADFGYKVQIGDWVQTGPDSAVDIVFDRANIFRLGQNTVAQLEIGTNRQEVDLKFGSFVAVFDRVRTLTGHGTFDVRTSTVVGGVRGTAFFFRVLDSDTTYMCTCNGALELTPSGSHDSFLNSAVEHSAYYFRSDGDEVTYEPATLEYHNSSTLDEVGAGADLSIPWGTLGE